MSQLPHILIVDDDESIRELLAKYLQQFDFTVSLAEDGKNLAALLQKTQFDLIILDIMLPGPSGLELCKMVRQQYTMPILMLTAVGEDADRIVGLELGADDYLTKPFNPRELLARINAILRRTQESVTGSKTLIYEFDGWCLDHGTRRLIASDGLEISLTSGEYNLLLMLLTHPQTVISRDKLYQAIHNRTASPFDRGIDVQISRLRHKLEIDPKNPLLIKTVRGGGYILTSEVTPIK